MGNILSQQQNNQINQNSQTKNNHNHNNLNNKNWKILQKTQYKEIIKSIKTGLIVQRYYFEIQLNQDFQQQNKLFSWRNHNPNSEFMINILSIHKDQTLENNNNNKIQCPSLGFCPSEKINTKVFVVTQRILKLAEITDLIMFQQQIDKSVKIQNRNSTSTPPKTQRKQKKKFNKFLPFINFNLNQSDIKCILKDWVRGIQVLCYKFGYFCINYDLLGINIRKRGNVWISQNYSINHLDSKNKIQVTTAQQKFKYEKDAIQKILLFTENIDWFKNIVRKYKNKKIQRFDDFVLLLDKRPSHQRNLTSQNIDNYLPITNNNNYQFIPNKKNNISLYVQPPSFLQFDQKNFSHNNSSFFQFDHQNVLKRINSNQKYLVALQDPQRHIHRNSNFQFVKNNLIHQNDRIMRKSKSGQKILQNLSPQSQHQSKRNLNFINSNHKNGGKQTAPTNQLGHSSSLQSVAHQFVSNMPINMNQQMLRQEGKSLFKSQNNTKIRSINQQIQSNQFKKPSSSPSNKIYFHHHNRQFKASQPYLFRSQNYNHVNKFNSPKANQKKIGNNVHNFHNYSLDENNIVGPYRKDKYYSNLKNEKIALVDSMVMVRQQSEEIQEDYNNISGTKIIMEESIILMGNDDKIEDTPRQNEIKSPSRKNSSFYH